MMDLIPLRKIMLDVSSVFGMKCDSCNSYTITFEDNKGAIELGKEPKYIPQTKQIFPLNCIILESISKKVHQR